MKRAREATGFMDGEMKTRKNQQSGENSLI